MLPIKLTRTTHYFLLLAVGAFSFAKFASAADETAARIGKAVSTFNALTDSAHALRPELIRQAECIAVIPGFKKGAAVVGARLRPRIRFLPERWQLVGTGRDYTRNGQPGRSDRRRGNRHRGSPARQGEAHEAAVRPFHDRDGCLGRVGKWQVGPRRSQREGAVFWPYEGSFRRLRPGQSDAESR